MAEQIPYCVIASLINSLASPAVREFGCVYGLSAELDKPKTTIESIRAALSDAEERQHQHPIVNVWIRRLKEVVHDANKFETP